MKRRIIYFLGLTAFVVLLNIWGCERKSEYKLNSKDSVIVIENALNYILENSKLVDEYYNQPLQIIVPKGLGTNSKIAVNKLNATLLPDTTKPSNILKSLNIFKPIPLVEIPTLEKSNDTILVEIILRSTGHNFMMKLKEEQSKKFHVIQLKERTI